MNAIKKILIACAIAIVIAFARAGSAAAATEQGPNQCYHRIWQDRHACTSCANTCKGAGYRCCSYVADSGEDGDLEEDPED